MRDDSEVIASYIPLVSFLGEVVGRNTEVVLHDLADIDASVVAIVNGEVSGRTVGSPATDLVLRELEEDSGEPTGSATPRGPEGARSPPPRSSYAATADSSGCSASIPTTLS